MNGGVFFLRIESPHVDLLGVQRNFGPPRYPLADTYQRIREFVVGSSLPTYFEKLR
jgi:hypothetical protein